MKGVNGGELERELRGIPGVVACAIGPGHISLLLSESADRARVEADAAAIAARHGGAGVRILASPSFGRGATRAGSASRTRLAAGAAGAAAIALIVSLVPIGKRLVPAPQPPAAFRPAPAFVPSGPTVPVMVVPVRAVSPGRTPGPAAPPAAPRRATPPRSSRGTPPVVDLPPVVIPPTPDPGDGAGGHDCTAPGVANGREHHHNAANTKHHRPHAHSGAHPYDHWFEC